MACAAEVPFGPLRHPPVALQISQAAFLPWVPTVFASQTGVCDHPVLPYPALVAGFAHQILPLLVVELVHQVEVTF